MRKRDRQQVFRNVRELKRLCVNHLGGACSQCGLQDDIVDVFDFHHTDETKDANICKLIARHAEYHAPDNIPQHILDELSKCEVVCTNCHRKLTYYEKLKRLEAGQSATRNANGRPVNHERHKLIRQLLNNGLTVMQLAKQLKCTRQAIYGAIERSANN